MAKSSKRPWCRAFSSASKNWSRSALLVPRKTEREAKVTVRKNRISMAPNIASMASPVFKVTAMTAAKMGSE